LILQYYFILRLTAIANKLVSTYIKLFKMSEPDTSGGEENLTTQYATSILAIVSFLVALSILFEKAKHKLQHAISEIMKPVLDTFFGKTLI